jgi:hypothetical protein
MNADRELSIDCRTVWGGIEPHFVSSEMLTNGDFLPKPGASVTPLACWQVDAKAAEDGVA